MLMAPMARTLTRWNWKSAVPSSIFRAILFLIANWSAGPAAAFSAMGLEFAYRSVTAGFHGALTQSLRGIEPAWRGAVAASLLLPAAGNSLEWLLHKLRGTPNLRTSIAASVIFTMVSSLFHLFSMRRGHFIAGERSLPLREDLRQVPALLRDFVLTGPRLLAPRGRTS